MLRFMTVTCVVCVNYTTISGNPPTFSCHRTRAQRDRAMVTYDECTILTPGMNAATGRFTAREDGVYQLTFTAMFVAIRGHMVSGAALLEAKLPYDPLYPSVGRYVCL